MELSAPQHERELPSQHMARQPLISPKLQRPSWLSSFLPVEPSWQQRPGSGVGAPTKQSDGGREGWGRGNIKYQWWVHFSKNSGSFTEKQESN